eukprot:g1926.t1
MNKSVSVLVWGATGVTGRRVCHQLASLYQNQVTWAIAGRSQSKLENLRAELQTVNRSCKDLPILVADIKDRSSVAEMVKQSKLVLACAGPFPLYSDIVVECCVEEGRHFLDVTGETLWVRTVIDRFHDVAKSKNVKIVNCCGFDSVPADIGTLFLVKKIRAKYARGVTRILGCYSSHSAAKVQFSGGTFASFLNLLSLDASQKKLQQDPYLLNPKDSVPSGSCPVDHTGPEYDNDFKFWKAPFLMEAVNSRVVRRSVALSKEIYGAELEYRECSKMTGYFQALQTSLGMLVLFLVVKISMFRWLALQLGLLPRPGEGPSVEDEAKSKWELALYGLVESNLTTPDAKPVIAEAYISDRYGGYTSTARMAVECAMCEILDSEKLQTEGLAKGGVLTPATAFGDTLIDRLANIGIVIQSDDSESVMRGTETREIGTDEGPSFAVEITQIDDPHRISLETHPVYNASTASCVGDQDSLVECRICLQTDKVSNLVQPCSCHGTLSYCHYSCLESWVKESRKLKCEICGNSYTTEIKEQLREVITRAEQIDQERRRVLSLGAQLEAIAGAHQDEGTLHTPRSVHDVHRLFVDLSMFAIDVVY